jgi:hypothetical protein
VGRVHEEDVASLRAGLIQPWRQLLVKENILFRDVFL